MSRENTIEKKQAELKKIMLDHLRKMPNVQLVCEKIGVGRTTFYAWCKRSEKFRRQTDEAKLEGRLFMSDFAEGQLFSLIKDGKIEAIRLYLQNNHPLYVNKLEIKGNIMHEQKELSPEQKKMIRQALKLAAFNKQPYEQSKPTETTK